MSATGSITALTGSVVLGMVIKTFCTLRAHFIYKPTIPKFLDPPLNQYSQLYAYGQIALTVARVITDHSRTNESTHYSLIVL